MKPNMKPRVKPGVIKRLLARLFKRYGLLIVVVLVCIVANSLCTVQGTLFMQSLIDDYIMPLLAIPEPQFNGLLKAISRVGMFYGIGIICSFTQQRIMAFVTQSFLDDLRVEIFEHMQKLPIKYFDTTTHGDIMSVYTNDTDTLRQLISQSIPNFISSIMTISTVFISMIYLCLPLTCISVIMLSLMIMTSRKVGGLAGKYFMQQQRSIGKLNGFIEEMISGQKVVKVFNHEDAVIEQFKEVNHELRDSAYNAHRFANVLMPVTVQLGNISYIICAVAGATMSLSGIASISVGTLVSFLTLNKSFNGPVGQMSMQLNNIAMATAGASRIFELLD